MKTETFYTYELIDNCNGFDEYETFDDCKSDLIYTLHEQSHYQFLNNKDKVYLFEKVKRVYDNDSYMEHYDILFKISVYEWLNDSNKQNELRELIENESTN